MAVKIIIVDDHPVVRQGIKMFIESEKHFIVCGEAGNANDAIKQINKNNPDVVIVDISLEGETSGLELIKAIRNRFPNVYTLVLSMHEESRYAERALKAGARGYIMKKEAQEKIMVAINKILDGGVYLSQTLSDKFITKFLHGNTEENNPINILTDKEFEIFRFIAEGLSSKEIAKRLNLSKNTIDSHKRNIKEKLQLRNSAELMKKAVEWSMSG
jgi:DNA-binding NarL/FixJ family response regulator